MIGKFLTATFLIPATSYRGDKRVHCSNYQFMIRILIRWDGKYFKGWNFCLDILQTQENWAVRNLITNSSVYSLLIYTQAKMQTEINNNKRMAAFWPIGTAQIIRIVSYPIRKKSRFWLFCMWSVKEMYHALLPKADYRDKGKGHDRRQVRTAILLILPKFFCVVCYTVFHVFCLNLVSVVFHTDFCFASFLLFSKV